MQVYQVAQQQKTDITELWGNNEVSVIFWARSMGCFFCQYASVMGLIHILYRCHHSLTPGANIMAPLTDVFHV